MLSRLRGPALDTASVSFHHSLIRPEILLVGLCIAVVSSTPPGTRNPGKSRFSLRKDEQW